MEVGTVSQVGVDENKSLVLLVEASDGATSLVPWAQVRKIGHVVLLSAPEAEPEPAPAPEAEPDTSGKCSQCDFANSSDSKFCESCGANLAK